MNLLLRLLERRFIVGIAVVLSSLWAWERWSAYARSRAEHMLYPPAEAASSLAVDIKKDVEAQESARLRGLHRAVSAEIAAASADGFKVEKLQTLADGALELDTPIYRFAAIERLNRLRLLIPRKKEAFRPAAAGDMNPDRFETPTSKSKAL